MFTLAVPWTMKSACAPVGKITALYPAIDTADVEDALDLECELQPDLALAA